MFRYPGRGWFLSGWLAWVLTTSTCAQPTATPRLSTSREPALRHSLASLLPTCEQETHSQHSTHARAVWPSSTWERGVVWEATALHSTPSRSALDTWTQQADAVQCSAVQCSASLKNCKTCVVDEDAAKGVPHPPARRCGPSRRRSEKKGLGAARRGRRGRRRQWGGVRDHDRPRWAHLEA